MGMGVIGHFHTKLHQSSHHVKGWTFITVEHVSLQVHPSAAVTASTHALLKVLEQPACRDLPHSATRALVRSGVGQ